MYVYMCVGVHPMHVQRSKEDTVFPEILLSTFPLNQTLSVNAELEASKPQ